MEQQLIDFLNTFIQTKKPDWDIQRSWSGDSIFMSPNLYGRDRSLSKEEIIEKSTQKVTESSINYIPEALYNKKFTIADFTIHIQFVEAEHYEESSYARSSGCRRDHLRLTKQWNVIISWHGVYYPLLKFVNYLNLELDHCLPSQTNWFHISPPTEEKPFMFWEGKIETEFEYYKPIKDLFKFLEDATYTTDKDDIVIYSPNYYTSKNLYNGKDPKSLREYTVENIDIEWFVKNTLKTNKDGSIWWAPDFITIRDVYHSWVSQYSWDRERDSKPKYDRKLLQKLGVTVVQLNNEAHLDIKNFFDLKDIKIKAPQKVIEKYSLEKVCYDPKQVETIKAEKAQAERDAKLNEYNRQFTLIYHGKVIKKDKDLDDIIEYLENFNAKDFEEEVIKKIQPIFNKFPSVEYLYLAAWGTYYKYECGGERYFYGDFFYEHNSHIDEDVFTEINDLYSKVIDSLPIDEKAIEVKYGITERGGTQLGVKRTKTGKLKLFTEDYDPE